MDRLKLKYVIELVSNLGDKARADADRLAAAQRHIREALQGTNREIGLTERALLRLGGVHSQSINRQADYLARLAMRYHEVRRAAESAVSVMTKAAQIGAGAAAGAYAADRVTRAPMDYSMRLAQMANTAYSDRDAAGRIQGKGVLDAAIRAAVRTGGGKIDDAAGALDTLIASGAVSREQAIRMLPSLMRGSTASGATPTELATIGLRGMQTFGINVDQLPEAINMAMAAGQAGGFELKDMAKWLPQAMAMGKQSGLSGMEGFRRIIGSMQASVITAGSKDEAGNNLVNLLGKINSSDTANDFKKLGYDLPGKLARMRGKGVNSLDAFVSFVDEIASKDQQFVALKKKLQKGGTTAEKAETMQAMADILQGKAVGKVIQDRQALMALVAEMNNREYVKSVMDKTRTDKTAVSTAYDVISAETGFKREQAANEVVIAGNEAFSKVAPAMNRVFETSTDVARQFPVLTTAVVGSTAALGVFAAALGGGSLIGMLRGGGTAGAGSAAASAGRTGLAALGKAGLVGAAGVAGWTAGSALYERTMQGTSFGDSIGRAGAKVAAFFGSSNAREALEAEANARRMNRFGPGRSSIMNDVLSLTAPGAAAKSLPLGQPTELKVGEGRLTVDVKLTDGRTQVTTDVTKPMSIIRINPGNTNPAGY